MEQEQILRRADIAFAFFIGLVVGLLSLPIISNFSDQFEFLRLGWIKFLIPFALAFGSMLGVWIASIIAQRIFFIWQVAKFGLVGTLNTFIDLGVLNILIFITGIERGVGYTFFAGASFLVAVFNSYFWNKFWTFRATQLTSTGKEFIQFVVISLIGVVVNVIIASLIVNVVGAPSGVDPKVWANVGKVAAIPMALIWNFIGYKFIVFKR